ncbi:MAG: CDP-alcohol phosphatidyltransferase family protein [Waddliaceae bacterium]|jgi:CDP-diacylglycerol---glycerol-3-phosphate 3-phosphatidyltransferase|nr:CDP-alcohol phosphatidyltransferase family protein [Waddliaceae bacterium]MBT7461576.1 CDP-alcohol phosphatidyltransferase family protein [Waddliaceae bacterium]
MMIHDKGIFTISNILTIARAPMAIFFLVENSMVRLIIVAVAMITDGIDGYIARRYNMESQVGRFLDPIMDKFFVFFVLAVLVSEGRLVSWNLFAMVFRDACLCAFGAYVSVFGTWERCSSCTGIWLSKVTTAFQFAIIIGLSLGYIFPAYLYISFMGLGLLSLGELCLYYKRTPIISE